jgi:Ca-activated chloride channel family protein
MGQQSQANMISRIGTDLMLQGVKASGAVKGRLLVMSLQQSYRNTSDTNTEITYTFPLPFGAVLLEVEVELNGEQLKGEVTAKSTARARYEATISTGNTGILLERNHDGSFTLELGNLMAREECKIMVRYGQLLATEHGQIRLMLPTTIAPRYGNPLTEGRLQPHQVPVTDMTAQYSFGIDVMLFGELGQANVSSPSHSTGYYPVSEGLMVRLAQRGHLDRDFVLVISDLKHPSDALAAPDLYVEGQYAVMANFNPSFALAKNANAADTTPIGITTKILVDCSGSMNGDSIEAARRALTDIVNGLRPEDRFSLSRFGSTAEHRSRGLWQGTAQARASALRWIDAVQADLGGTEMAQALVSTIALAEGAASDILLVTDGEIHGIDEVIRIASGSRHRVFVVGIGASAAEVHLRRLAAATGGMCDFVAPGEAVEPAVLRMFSRLRAPQAKNVRVEWPAGLTVRWAQPVQDYAFENDALSMCAFVTLSAKALEESQGLGSVKLWGQLQQGGPEVLMGEAALNLTESTTNTVARMTAFTQYSQLERESEALAIPSSLTTGQDLAVQYRLVTRQTNFILVHERVAAEQAQEMPTVHTVPQMLAAGWGGTGSVTRSLGSPGRAMRSFDDSLPTQSSAMSFSKMHLSVNAMVQEDSLSRPSVWRSRRPAAAASKPSLQTGGVDDFEVPAFLRKSADDLGPAGRDIVQQSINKNDSLLWRPAQTDTKLFGKSDPFAYVGITPAGITQWLAINHPSLWPTTYGQLRELGLGLAICEWLEFGVGQDLAQEVVIGAFFDVLREFNLDARGGLRQAGRSLKNAIYPQTKVEAASDLHVAIRLGLKGVKAKDWPLGVLEFPAPVIA